MLEDDLKQYTFFYTTALELGDDIGINKISSVLYS